MDMAEVIRRRRAELGLSQADLAKAAGVDPHQIRRYEAGQQQPVLPVAVAIAKCSPSFRLTSPLRRLP
jgi:transcriptional regulator with XRE-family HTH domain